MGRKTLAKVDGRPVVFMYLNRVYSGDVQKAIGDLRDKMREKCYVVYLIGDVVFIGIPLMKKE